MKTDSKLLNDLFQANNYTCFFRRNNFCISRKIESKVKKMYETEILNPKITTKYRYNTDELEYFFNIG